MSTSPKDQVDSTGKKVRDSGRERSKLLSGKTKPGYNSETSLLDTLRKLQVREYQENTYDGFTQHQGIVVKNPFLNKPNPIEGDYPVRVRVRIPALHKGLPLIADGNDCQTQDLYPEFIAESLETTGGSQPKIGDEVTVTFIDRHQSTLKYSNGIIVGKTGNKVDIISGQVDSPLLNLIKKKCADRQLPNTPVPKENKLPNPPGSIDPDSEPPAEGSNNTPQPTTATTLEQFRKKPNLPCDEQALLEDFTKAISAVTADDLAYIKKKIWYDNPAKNYPISRSISKLHPYIRKEVADLFNEIAKDGNGVPLKISSGFRSVADQERILRSGNYHGNPGRGGNSYHNYGFAIDIRISTETVQFYMGKGKFSQFTIINSNLLNSLIPWVAKKVGDQYKPADLTQPKKHYYMDDVAKVFIDQGWEWGQNFTSPDLPHFQKRPRFNGTGSQYPKGGAGARALLQRVWSGKVDKNGYVIP
jgi:hypothetical protein